MALPNTAALEDDANWAVERVTSLPEFWALVAEHTPTLVGLHRLMGVCRASRAGGGEFLSTVSGLVVCGGVAEGIGLVRDVWRLDLATMQWEHMPALVTARFNHACCAVRGALVVLGGRTQGGLSSLTSLTSSVETLSSGQGAFVELTPLSCGGIRGVAAIPVEESDSALEQVLLLGCVDNVGSPSWTVQLVDLATGACVPQGNLLHSRYLPAAGRLPDGRVVCAGGMGDVGNGRVC
jgi:hypothetical protein